MTETVRTVALYEDVLTTDFSPFSSYTSFNNLIYISPEEEDVVTKNNSFRVKLRWLLLEVSRVEILMRRLELSKIIKLNVDS
jgi:hypothetical protein